MAEKVLVIDDDSGLLTFLQLGLKREGFDVYIVNNGKEGLQQAYELHPDVIILDVMMPDMDGWTTCQRLRHVCDTPIIMLTAKTEIPDVVKGLSLGADDYITKPCSFEELKARINSILRRVNIANNASWRSVYDDGNLRIDLETGVVSRQGEIIELTDTESRLLLYLVSQKDRIVPHKELLTKVWGPQYAKEVGYLSVYIRYIRLKLEDDPSNPTYVRKRWGMGYYFTGHGEVQSAPPLSATP
jgi:DNA-binding response OmpR family regulator